MPKQSIVAETELASLAKKFRLEAGKSKIEAAAELGVGRPSVQLAEEHAEQSLAKLRRRMIERYSPYEVVGPLYLLRRKRRSRD